MGSACPLASREQQWPSVRRLGLHFLVSARRFPCDLCMSRSSIQSCVTACSAQSDGQPEPQEGSAETPLATSHRLPPALPFGSAVSHQQPKCSPCFFWAGAHFAGTLHAGLFSPGRAACSFYPPFGEEKTDAETLSDLCRVTEMANHAGWLQTSHPEQPHSPAPRGPLFFLLRLGE